MCCPWCSSGSALPEIVGYDYGRHNADLTKSTARIVQGASWKRQRIIALIPSATMIPAKVALSHWNLAFPPNQGVYRMLCLGMEVGDAYSQAIESILAHPELSTWEYLLTLEHDNVPPPDGVMRLLERMDAHPEFDCIGGLYWTKGEGGVAQIWGDARDPQTNFRPQPPDPAGGLVECCGTGMGFNLWRMSMFKDARLRRPWFKTQTVGGCATQDLYAWTDFRKNGHRCAIDCSVLVGHYDHVNDITW
jgi:hypothetical protein